MNGTTNPIAPNNSISKGDLVEPGVYRLNLGAGADGETTYKYTDSTGKWLSNYTPTMQTTTQQDKKDTTLAKKIDLLANPQTQPVNPATNPTGDPTKGTQPTGTNPDGTPKTTPATTFKAPDGVTDVSETPQAGGYAYKTPATLQAGEKIGYGTDGKRYIIGKDGKVKNDPFADQEYAANEASIKKEQERTALYDSLKTSLDTSHQQLLDSITKTFAVRRAKMEDINKRYLALKQNEGFSGGQARYMSDINNGVLQDNEEQGNMRLAELDAQEKTLVAQAVQAKTAKDFELAFKKMDEVDKIQKEKQDTVQAVYKAAVDFNKSLDNQEKELRLKEKDQLEKATKALTASAPALVQAYDQLKTSADKQTFITNMAKKLGTSEEIVLGTMQDQRTQNLKDSADINAKNRSNTKTGGASTVDNFGNEAPMSPQEAERTKTVQGFFTQVDKMIATGFKNSKGVPVATDSGYLTYAAFKDLLQTAIQMGATREEFINRYQDKLNLSTFSRAQSGYGLTDAEYTKLKK